MYDPLYSRFEDFEEREGTEIEAVVAPSHPELNARINREFGSGEASYDLISTHTKYAPSQARWLSPLDGDLNEEDLRHFSAQTLRLAHFDGVGHLPMLERPAAMDEALVDLIRRSADRVRPRRFRWRA